MVEAERAATACAGIQRCPPCRARRTRARLGAPSRLVRRGGGDRPAAASFGGRDVKTGQPYWEYWEGSASTGICVSVGGAPESCGRVDVSMIGFGRGMV